MSWLLYNRRNGISVSCLCRVLSQVGLEIIISKITIIMNIFYTYEIIILFYNQNLNSKYLYLHYLLDASQLSILNLVLCIQKLKNRCNYITLIPLFYQILVKKSFSIFWLVQFFSMYNIQQCYFSSLLSEIYKLQTSGRITFLFATNEEYRCRQLGN